MAPLSYRSSGRAAFFVPLESTAAGVGAGLGLVSSLLLVLELELFLLVKGTLAGTLFGRQQARRDRRSRSKSPRSRINMRSTEAPTAMPITVLADSQQSDTGETSCGISLIR